MLAAYETTIPCPQNKQMSQAIVDNAINRYLALHPTVFPLARQDFSVKLLVQKSYRSSGERLSISIQDKCFEIISRCTKESHQLIAWGKNRDNVYALSECIKKAMEELSYSAA